MKNLLLFVFVLLSFNLKSQEGFINAYDFDELAVTFHNMLIKEDTLIVCGEIKSSENLQWGALFVKFDTLGNILDFKMHFDSLGDSYSFEQGYEFINTSDGGYAMVGQMFYRHSPVLLKLDVNGDLEYVREFPDTTVYSTRFWNIIEIDNGYIGVGIKQQMSDGKSDAFIIRLNEEGEIIWEVEYGTLGIYDSLRGLKKINDNKILVIGGSYIGSLSVPTLYDAWIVSKVLQIDALGNITPVWNSGVEFYDHSSTTPIDLHKDFDNNWVHEASYSRIVNGEEIVYQGEIVKRDTNFNVIWSTRFGEPTSNKNNFIDLVNTPDGGWVAAGQYLTLLTDSSVEAYLGGWLAKINSEGDSLWSRTDTVFWNPISSSTNYLSGIVTLPSGSIVACGHLNRYDLDIPASLGWLIKVNKNGCIEPGCNPIWDGVNLTPLIESFKMFPNPTSDQLKIEGQGCFQVSLHDSSGKVIIENKQACDEITLNLAPISPGPYFVSVRIQTKIFTKKIIVY